MIRPSLRRVAPLLRPWRERFVRWALRVRAPEPVPVVLVQRRIYVLPTRAGLLYAVALLVILIGAINYNLSLGYLLVFLLAGLGIAGTLHTFRNLLGLALAPGSPAAVFVGEKAVFPLLLHNPAARPRVLLQLCPEGGAHVACDIDGQTHTRVDLCVPTTRRGWQALPRIVIDSRWPLGLVRAWAYAAPAAACLVYPRPADAVPPPPTIGPLAGGRLASDSGDEDFAGLRRHQPSDPPHHVAWKAAARQPADAPLQTKLFAGTAAQSLWLDWAALPSGLPVEERLSILARWVLDADAAGLAWGLRLPDRTLPQACGAAQRHAALQALALFPG